MDKWRGKVAVVTGASSGIGAHIALSLANAGLIVVGLARRHGLIQVVLLVPRTRPSCATHLTRTLRSHRRNWALESGQGRGASTR